MSKSADNVSCHNLKGSLCADSLEVMAEITLPFCSLCWS